MSTKLIAALKELALQPGESRWVWVDDYCVEIRRLALDEAGTEPTPIFVPRIEITESDLAPGPTK